MFAKVFLMECLARIVWIKLSHFMLGYDSLYEITQSIEELSGPSKQKFLFRVGNPRK